MQFKIACYDRRNRRKYHLNFRLSIVFLLAQINVVVGGILEGIQTKGVSEFSLNIRLLSGTEFL